MLFGDLQQGAEAAAEGAELRGFDESLWAGLVDSMTVHSKDWIVFRLTCGMEIEAQTKQLCRNKM